MFNLLPIVQGRLKATTKINQWTLNTQKKKTDQKVSNKFFNGQIHS